jgi:excisionase family DNA binding protein
MSASIALSARPQVTPQTDPLLSIEELASYLNVSKWAIYNLISRKKSDLPRIKIGREWRFRLSSVDRWLAALEYGGAR